MSMGVDGSRRFVGIVVMDGSRLCPREAMAGPVSGSAPGRMTEGEVAVKGCAGGASRPEGRCAENGACWMCLGDVLLLNMCLAGMDEGCSGRQAVRECPRYGIRQTKHPIPRRPRSQDGRWFSIAHHPLPLPSTPSRSATHIPSRSHALEPAAVCFIQPLAHPQPGISEIASVIDLHHWWVVV